MNRGKSSKKSQPKDKTILPQLVIQPEREETTSPKKKQTPSINSENFVICRVGNFDDHYLISGKIGQGSFGTVYRVLHKALKIQRALKTIKKRSNEHHSSFEEIEVLKKLDHSNILKIYQFYDAPDSYYIITEIFEGRELFDVIIEQDKLTERDAANILREVLRAVNYTHSQGIAHRDIKPQNILVRKESYGFRVKIIDWGLGTLMGDIKSNRICGTPEYCAPQVLRGNYSLSCDMWSIGAISYVMLTGEMPFTGQNTEQTINVVKKGLLNINKPAFKALPTDAKNFIVSLMNKNCEKRLTAEQALSHPWIQKNSSAQIQPFQLKETLERLREYQLGSSLSTAVVSFINNHLSQASERQKLEKIFKHLDRNSDGVLSLEELIDGYTKIYGRELGRQIAEETFSKLDMNHNGSLEFSQFVTFGLLKQKETGEQKIREAFQLFDRDHSGRISKEELALVLKGKVEAALEVQLKEIVDEIDQNGDGEIDVEQFIRSIEKVGATESKEVKEVNQIFAVQNLQEKDILPTIKKGKEINAKKQAKMTIKTRSFQKRACTRSNIKEDN